MPGNFEIDPYDPCPCGSGKKYKFCCRASAPPQAHGKYPIGTVARYGPDDKTTTKIAAGVIVDEHATPVLERWTGENVANDPAIRQQIKHFFAKNGVKNVVVTEGNLGCPHEEGIDFPVGQDCPLCPFWAGKQGTARRNHADAKSKSLAQLEEEEDFADDIELDEDDEDTQDDYDEIFARVEKIVGPDMEDMGKAMDRIFAHLEANLQLPCEVTGVEDFQWEEPYIVGGWDYEEYEQLKKVQPSYADKYQLLGISKGESSEWMLFSGDLAAHVKRVSDGKVFVLGLAELKATDKQSQNYQLLRDYGVWFVNSR